MLPLSSGGGNSLKVQAVTCESNPAFCSQVAQEGRRGPEEVKLILLVYENLVLQHDDSPLLVRVSDIHDAIS